MVLQRFCMFISGFAVALSHTAIMWTPARTWKRSRVFFVYCLCLNAIHSSYCNWYLKLKHAQACTHTHTHTNVRACTLLQTRQSKKPPFTPPSINHSSPWDSYLSCSSNPLSFFSLLPPSGSSRLEETSSRYHGFTSVSLACSHVSPLVKRLCLPPCLCFMSVF